MTEHQVYVAFEQAMLNAWPLSHFSNWAIIQLNLKIKECSSEGRDLLVAEIERRGIEV